MLAANAPDVDVLSYARGPYFALSFRRGITHGWPALMVLPLAVTAAMLAWDRWVRRRRTPEAPAARAGPTLLLSAVGVLTHPTLDWMNTYGMRWSLPFDGSWSYGDALFIIDPWIWLALGGSIVLATRPGRRGLLLWSALAATATVLVVAGMPTAAPVWILGLVAVAWLLRVGRPATASGRTAVAATATLVVTVYVCALTLLEGVTRADARAAAEGLGLQPTDVMVAPMPGRLFTSEVEAVTRDAYVPGVHRWLSTPRVELDTGAAVPRVAGPAELDPAALDEVVNEASGRSPAREYLVWSRYPYVRVTPDGDGWRVRFADARYDARPADGPGGSLVGVEVRVPR